MALVYGSFVTVNRFSTFYFIFLFNFSYPLIIIIVVVRFRFTFRSHRSNPPSMVGILFPLYTNMLSPL